MAKDTYNQSKMKKDELQKKILQFIPETKSHYLSFTEPLKLEEKKKKKHYYIENFLKEMNSSQRKRNYSQCEKKITLREI